MRITNCLLIKTMSALFFAVLLPCLAAGCLLGDDIENLRIKAGKPSDNPAIPEFIVPGNDLKSDLDWLFANAVSGGFYTIEIRNDESINGSYLYFDGKTVHITLKGDNLERIITINDKNTMFNIGQGVTLSLDKNITLAGNIANSGSLVRVGEGGSLNLRTGSKITGNATEADGGGVCVIGGVIYINGGTITGNTSANNGGGVYIEDGNFTMLSGEISANSAVRGGGVYVSFIDNDDGIFNKTGGIIYGTGVSGIGNNASLEGSAAYLISSKLTDIFLHRNSTLSGTDTINYFNSNGNNTGWE
ncbi:MAG: hypothetical protein FWC17_04530 [Treponema sp.]|nr:hypothetical protein [Treponema sp.]